MPALKYKDPVDGQWKYLPSGQQGPQGIQGVPGAPGSTGPAGPGVPLGGATGYLLTKRSATDLDTGWVAPLPYLSYNLSGAGTWLTPVAGQITTNSQTVGSVSQINVHYLNATGSDMRAYLRHVSPGQVLTMQDPSTTGNTASYRVVTVTDTASSYVTFTVVYILGTGGFTSTDKPIALRLAGSADKLSQIKDIAASAPVDGDALLWDSATSTWRTQPVARGIVQRVLGSGTAAVSTTPVVLMTMNSVPLRSGRNYMYCFQVRAVSATAQSNGSIIYDMQANLNMTLNWNVPIPAGGTGMYTGIHIRTPLTVSVTGNYLINVKFALGAGTGTIYLDQGGYLAIEDMGR